MKQMKTMRIIRIAAGLCLCWWILMTGTAELLQAQPSASDYAKTIHVDGRDVQEVIDQAPAYSTIVGDDMERTIETGETIIIDKPLRLTNFRGRLAPGATGTRILQVDAEHVIIEDFRLYGNRETVEYSDRTSLLRILEGHFLVENGQLFDSMKHGIVVRSMEGDTEHGIIRNIVTRNIRRDGISLTGYGDLGFFNRNILVENITVYGSNDRGAVEISDGNEQITVRNIYADTSRYGVEIQDHERQGQVNSDIVIEGVHVSNTMAAVNFNLSDYGHGNITIRDIAGDSWPEHREDRFRDSSPVDIRNVGDVTVDNVHITDNDNRPAMAIRDSDGLMVRNVFVANKGESAYPSILITDVSNLFLDGVNVRSEEAMEAVVAYRLSGSEEARNVQISGISTTHEETAGIMLERDSPKATLGHYTITNNLVPVVDNINGSPSHIEGNIP